MYNYGISVPETSNIEFEKMAYVKNSICCIPVVVDRVMK